ncbi:hypothetical protein D9M69_499460 [compost metagenome]
MQRADRQRLGTTLAGYPGEVLQRLGVTKPAVAGAAQSIQLHAQAPGSRDRVVHGIGHAVATGRGHGESEVLSVHADLLIADRYQPRQHCVGVQFQVEPRTVLQVDFAWGPGLEKARQVQAHPRIGGDQWRQVMGLLRLLQFQQAGVDFLGTAGRVAQAGQHVAQHGRRDFLRAAVGVDPVDGEAGTAGQDFQLRITHGRSPNEVAKGTAAARLTSAQYGARVFVAGRSGFCGGYSNKRMASVCEVWTTGLALRFRSMRSWLPSPKRQDALTAPSPSTSVPSAWAPGRRGMMCR